MFEDQFKFNKNLSFTLGLRIYHLPLPYGVPNSETNWDAGVTPGNIYNNPAYVAANAPTVNEFSGATNLKYPATYSNGMLYNSGQSGGLPVNFSNAHTWYFAPDAGFAWDVFGNGKTSLRGGYGISYTRIFTNQDCSFNCIANPTRVQQPEPIQPRISFNHELERRGSGRLREYGERHRSHWGGLRHRGLAGGQLLARNPA